MDKSVQGILLHRIDHSESSSILKVLTPEEGLASFIWKGAKKNRKGGGYGSLTLPLNRLELNVRFRKEGELHHLKELRLAEAFQRIPFDPDRRNIAFFLGEFLYRTGQSRAPDPEFFEEVRTSIDMLDQSEDPTDLHLHFLARNMLLNGIAPPDDRSDASFFDVIDGVFRTEQPSHEIYLGRAESEALKRMLETPVQEYRRFIQGSAQRRRILEKLLEHHREHMGDFGKIQSLEVLQLLSSE